MTFGSPPDPEKWNVRLRLKLYRASNWLDDEIFQLTEKFPKALGAKVYDNFPELVDGGVIPWLLCTVLRAHEYEQDQCGKPEHDYCLLCRRRYPYSAGKVKERYFRLFERIHGTQYDGDPDPWGPEEEDHD